MAAHPKTARVAAVAPPPLAELLECPQETGRLLTGAAACVNFQAGEAIFRQGEPCKGLYLVIAGEFLRKAERKNMRVTLGPARSGELVELAAALGDKLHTYTLTALTQGTLLLLPMAVLEEAFAAHPPLRMRLLQELAREVSRAYLTCCMSRVSPARRRGEEPPARLAAH